MHDWNWISFLAGTGSGVYLTLFVASIVRTWKRSREAKRLALANDAAIRCRHGIKRWKVCTDCAADFAHINPCKTCKFPVDDRWPPGMHYCPGISGHSGFSGVSGISGFWGVSGYRGPVVVYVPDGKSGFSGITGFSPGPSGYSGYASKSPE